MLTIILSVLGIFLTIFFVVTIHELGHFIVARLLGVKVLRFSIGFGKPFYSWHDKKGTEYALAPIPLGGYVKMLDEQEGDVPLTELDAAYNRQPIYKRFLIAIAGPLFNLLFSFCLYWLLFVIGFVTFSPIVGKVSPDSIAELAGMKPRQEIVSVNQSATPAWMNVIIHILGHAGNKDTMQIQVKEPASNEIKTLNLNLVEWHLDDLRPEPLNSLGITPYEPQIFSIIEKVEPDSDAFTKLKKGDQVLLVDSKPIKNWNDLVKIIVAHPEKTLSFKINRNGKIIQIPITVGSKHSLFRKYGYLGVTPQFSIPKELIRKRQFGPLDALGQAWNETYDLTKLNFIILGKMLTGKISVKSLGGPITIFENAGVALNHGFIAFIGFLAFLSIAIGIINILPIPGLDGGHVLLQAIELVTRRPLSLKLQLLFFRLGFLVLILLIIQALMNDLMRL